jgi:hypothetical protein
VRRAIKFSGENRFFEKPATTRKLFLMKARRLRTRQNYPLRADRPSDAMHQNGHGNAAGWRRRLEEDCTWHWQGRHPLRLLAQHQNIRRR